MNSIHKSQKLLIAVIIVLVLAFCPQTAQAAEHYTILNQYQYTLIHEVVVQNSGSRGAFNVRVEVPLIDSYSPYYSAVAGEQLNPYPAEIVTAAGGRRSAVYTIPYIAGGSRVVLQQKYGLTAASVIYTYNTAATGQYSDLELTAFSHYLAAEENIEAHNSVINAFVTANTDSGDNYYQIARKLFNAVNLTLNYKEDDSPQGALAVLARKSGHCQGYTNLLIAALRSAGIPARQKSGYIFLPNQPGQTSVNGYIDLAEQGHTWVEFYLPDTGWIIADPTFTYNFTLADGSVRKFVDPTYFSMITTARRYVFFREGNLDDYQVVTSALGGNVSASISAMLTPGLHFSHFNDVGGHWAEDSIGYCYTNGLMNGVGNGNFAPEKPMTRAMFVTVLGRLYEQNGGLIDSMPAEDTDLAFTDIEASAYYYQYVLWAVAGGVIDGYSAERFGPDDAITREQMAKIIADFLRFSGQSVSGGRLGYTDSAAISGWAQSGVSYCSGSGLLSGFPDNSFRPKDNATRAQVASLIERLAAIYQQ